MDQYNIHSTKKGLQLLPGETDAFVVYFVPSEKGKKVCRSMLKAIWRNRKSKMCFADFCGDNILVSGTEKVSSEMSQFLGVFLKTTLNLKSGTTIFQQLPSSSMRFFLVSLL